MWFHHLINLFRASLQTFITALGTTVLGFGTLFFDTIVTVLVTLFRVRRKQGANAMRVHWQQDAKTTLETLFWVSLIIYGPIGVWSVMRTVYVDHERLVEQTRALANANATLEKELKDRKNNLRTTDPAFSNTVALLQMFYGYRNTQHSEPCVLWVSSPPETTSEIASELAQLSNSASGCFTFGPILGNPETDEEALDGMVPDAVIFHAAKDDKAANKLFDDLQNLFKMRRSYKLPEKHYELPPAVAGKEHLIWLQFGSHTKWNSEL